MQGNFGFASKLLETLKKYKAYNAANLDGGGSSVMYGKRKITAKESETINNPKGRIKPSPYKGFGN